MAVSAATYEQVALEDGDTTWEYVCGQLREKPSMTQAHNSVGTLLGFFIQTQLGLDDFRVRINSGRLRTAAGNAYVPDVAVLPSGLLSVPQGIETLETYDEPLPFVAEVWSPSTGDYDVEAKFPDYRERGDEVIWRVHPYDRTVDSWVRQTDGSYREAHFDSGVVGIPSLPGVAIDLEQLFR
ncbi:MAG: Uma2 family endonuclease [bacterium]